MKRRFRCATAVCVHIAIVKKHGSIVKMNLHEPSKFELAEFERAVDAYVDGIWWPESDYSAAVYQVLTTAEDIPRCLLVSSELKTTGDADDPALLFLCVHLDFDKFALRHALDRLSQLLPSRVILRCQKVEGDAYRQIGLALYTLGDYHVVCHALTGMRAGHSRALIDDVGMRLSFSLKPRHDGYDALTFCLAGTALPGLFPLFTWMTWARFPESRPQLLVEISATAFVSQRSRITYPFEIELALRLVMFLTYPETDVPEIWQFPWGDSETIRQLVFALHVRCIYHLSAIHFTAEERNIQGGGVDDLLFIVSKGTLVQELHQISGIALPLVVPFVEALIFGRGTTSPDPSLQPLVPLYGGSLAVPCIFLASSRSGRNLLSLHARVERRSFDAQSAAFESEMIERLQGAFRERFRYIGVNVQLPKSLGGEEIDLLVIDINSLTLFIGEARAMIMPADPNEVFRRLADMERKVRQLERKIKSIRQNIEKLLGWTGLESTDLSRKWEVVGAVVIAGHGGVLSEEPNLPIVPELVFKTGVAAIPSLRDLHGWLAGLSWLPQPGLHFRSHPTRHIFGDRVVEYSGFSDARPGEWLNTYLPATLARYSQQ